jgi:hypothetical protein
MAASISIEGEEGAFAGQAQAHPTHSATSRPAGEDSAGDSRPTLIMRP